MKFRVAKENLSGILESEYYEFDNKTQSFTPTKESPELEDIVFYKLYSESIDKGIKKEDVEVSDLSKLIDRLNMITDRLEESVDRLEDNECYEEDSNDEYEDNEYEDDEDCDDEEEYDGEDSCNDEDINEYIVIPQLNIITYK